MKLSILEVCGMRTKLNKIASSLLIEMLLGIDNPIEKCNIICEVVRRGKHSLSERDAIKNESKNNDIFWNNYLVSDFATAALHLLGWEKYSGNRNEIKELIESGLQFE